MSVLDGPGEGTWSVFAQKVVEQRDAAREERDALGIQLVAAQERLRLTSVCVGVLRGALISGGFTEHARNVAREALAALDTVPGDEVEPDPGPSPEGLAVYTLWGARQDVIESRTRLALRDEDSEWWRLKRKGPKARARPLSDWDYEELVPTGISATSEAKAVLWVMGAKGWRDL